MTTVCAAMPCSLVQWVFVAFMASMARNWSRAERCAADFDVARDVDWRCAAVEFLGDKTPSIKADVWSFGMTSWEIFSFGGTPFEHIGLPCLDSQAECCLLSCFSGQCCACVTRVLSGTPNALKEELSSGGRPAQPDGCSDDMQRLMTACWAASPKQRPVCGSWCLHSGSRCANRRPLRSCARKLRRQYRRTRRPRHHVVGSTIALLHNVD